MDVSLTLILVMAVLFACGVYAMLERSLTRVLIGFLLLGNATKYTPAGGAVSFSDDLCLFSCSFPQSSG